MIWIAAAALVAVVVAAFVPAALRAARVDATPEADVYRAQLRELERDRDRGTVAPEDYDAARAEIARRLLAVAPDETPATRGPGRVAIALAAAVVAAVGLGTYARIGAPGYADLPLAARIDAVEAARAARPRQAEAEAGVQDRIDAGAETAPLVEQLKDVLRARPDDERGHELLARHAAAIGDFEAAWRAQDRLLAIRDGGSAQDFATLAEMMILAAGGYVSPEAERALVEAGRLDRSNGLARYYAGLMYAQQGRPDLAWPIWRRLLAESPPGAPWSEPIRLQIEDVSARAGDPTPLSELVVGVGPTDAQIADAAGMSPEARMEMIAGMVDGLASRLATDGGPPSDWARLITAFGVLGRSDAAASVYAEARGVFGDDPAALDALARAAETAGLAP
ncbi:c-type cytochrome biogenesis protein CcmI [Jannaschia sp. Os4]|uniref:c-type cytochrome biogenesis protein CcmI n=1 Tax=Jannaschia sp. Os4 TaxID=2807617 RepID=UPI00193A7777|nr:c-type cytochrome biogenesis protein CcmI [Jannaschia sp. Os4]MBM2576468.1 c-type cytochrome biogenesis protein CcmI [Jannaschia sp. Os4]